VRTTITKILSFDAAHSLPAHEGKCRQLHGHTYKIEVTLQGNLQERGPETGMVMDFADLGEAIRRLVVDRLDHTHLNEVLDFAPTAEALAVWAFGTLGDAGLPVVRVRLWETATSFATVES
jgi:6-pyruvoyltetrahydropterin/6-carboxytetrahydropterin synthase